MARRYRDNPSPFEGFTFGQLKREELRLVEAIDDNIHFQRDPQINEPLQARLQELRRELRSLESAPISRSYPESAIPDHITFIGSEIKTLKSLERLSFDDGAFAKGSAYRAKREDLEETVRKVRELLEHLAKSRSQQEQNQAALDKSIKDLASVETSIADLATRLASRTIEEQQAAVAERESLLTRQRHISSIAYRYRQTIEELEAASVSILKTINHILTSVGYPLAIVAPVVAPSPEIGPLEPSKQPSIPQVSRAPAALPAELRQVYEKLSDDPTVKALQLQLRAAVEELTTAIEDREPAYIMKRLEAKVAQLHERITGVGQHRRYR